MRATVSLVLLLCVYLVTTSAMAQTAGPAHRSSTGEFLNPYLDAGFSRSRFFTYVQMRFFGDQPFAEYEDQQHKVPQVAPDLDAIRRPDPQGLQVTWIGHSTTLLQYAGVNVLTDPIFSERASPVGFTGPARYTPPALLAGDLPAIDYVVISHNHYDHLDLLSVKQLGNQVTWLVPLNVKTWFENEGITNVIELDWWQTKSFGTATFTATPTQHFSGRTLWDYAETLWASWMIGIGDKRIWFGGDTGYNEFQFKRVGKEYGPIDLGLIPIGAFEPRWFMRQMHIDPVEAVQVHRDIGSRFSIGVHWGTFRLSAEAIDAPMRLLKQEATQTGVRFVTVPIGQTTIVQ